ncbi:MAG: alpha/beta hydrolase [Planctomycetota bacterium]
MSAGKSSKFGKRLYRCLKLALLAYAVVVLVMFVFQRRFVFLPSNDVRPSGLEPWLNSESQLIGYRHLVAEPKAVWLMSHGNAGQAADRDYLVSMLGPDVSLYVLEYPGYGSRPGSPSRSSIGEAASEAYHLVRDENPDTAICLLGESLGSGPASELALENPPPDKVVLVVPYDKLVNAAAHRFFFLPVRLLLLDQWDNVKALQGYDGPVEIYAAVEDEIIPFEFAESLSEQVTGSKLIRLEGGHEEWPLSKKMRLSYE